VRGRGTSKKGGGITGKNKETQKKRGTAIQTRGGGVGSWGSKGKKKQKSKGTVGTWGWWGRGGKIVGVNAW